MLVASDKKIFKLTELSSDRVIVITTASKINFLIVFIKINLFYPSQKQINVM